MNYVELEQVLKVTDICNIIGTKKGFSDNVFIANRAVNRNLYEWKNIKFHCPGLDRTIIRGELPSEVVNYIKVRFNRDFLDSAGKNIYHVFSKECLLVLILALKDYYSCKEGLNSNELSKYNEYINKINDNLIELSNPNIKSEEWINSIGIYDDYIKGREKWNNTTIGRNFLSAIEEFEDAVNPLSNENIDMDKVHELMLQGKIKVVPIISDKTKMYENYCKIEIYSDDNASHVCYERNADGYDYFLVYTTKASRMCFYHRYRFDEYDFEENEKIFCRHEVYGVEKRIEYSITNDKLYCNKDLDVDTFGILYDQLLCAIKYAKEITTDRLLKDKDKTLTK